MRGRGVWFTTILMLVAAAVTVPFVAEGVNIAWRTYQNRYCEYSFLGLDQEWWSGSPLCIAPMVDGRFYHHGFPQGSSPEKFKIGLYSVDPETGTKTTQMVLNSESQELELDLEAIAHSTVRIAGDANQVWLVLEPGKIFQFTGTRWIEEEPIEHGVTPPFSFSRQSMSHLRVFAFNGVLSTLTEDVNEQWELFQFVDSTWKSRGLIQLLDRTCDWQLPGEPSVLIRSTEMSTVSAAAKGTASYSITGRAHILPIGTTGHLFWNISDRLLYRRGFETVPVRSGKSDSSVQDHPVEEAISALEPANVAQIAHDWTLVSDNVPATMKWIPIAVAGEPAVVLIDEPSKGRQIVRALRMQGAKWVEFATQELPFPSFNLNCGSNTDGATAYLVSVGLWGRIRTYAIEPTGFRKARYEVVPWSGMSGFRLIADTILLSMGAGLLLGSVAELLMRLDPKQRDFRLASVTLATIWRRGFARAIDLALLILIVAGVFYIMTQAWNVDWFATAEAYAVKGQDIPSLAAAKAIGVTCEIVLGTVILCFIVVQGYWSTTPGKWICGLRVLRTTLEPCGFRRSLLRELLMCLDSLNLLSWTPGILFIAFTEHRQRFGDLVSDTIVVRDARRTQNQISST